MDGRQGRRSTARRAGIRVAVLGLVAGLATPAAPADADAEQAPADGAALRADGSRVAASTLRYRISVAVGGEEYAFHSNVERSRQSWNGAPVWRVETRAQAPAGDLVDTVYLREADLVPVHRTVQVGQGRVVLDVGSDGVSGVIAEPGADDQLVAIPSKGPVVGHLATALAGAALAPGFEARFRTLDLQRQQVHEWRATLSGVESVEVPAGRFGTYRLELVDLDGDGLAGTVWMTRERPHRMVRSELTGGAAGGRIVAALALAQD